MPRGGGLLCGQFPASALSGSGVHGPRSSTFSFLELREMAWGMLHAVRGSRKILVVGDNAAVVAVLEKGHCAVRLGNTVLENLFRVADGAGAGMLSRWIATDRMPADELSRWGTAEQDWADPPLDGVGVAGGGFVWTDDSRLDYYLLCVHQVFH